MRRMLRVALVIALMAPLLLSGCALVRIADNNAEPLVR